MARFTGGGTFAPMAASAFCGQCGTEQYGASRGFAEDSEGLIPHDAASSGPQFHISRGVAGDSVPTVAEVRDDRWGHGYSDPRTMG